MLTAFAAWLAARNSRRHCEMELLKGFGDVLDMVAMVFAGRKLLQCSGCSSFLSVSPGLTKERPPDLIQHWSRVVTQVVSGVLVGIIVDCTS